MRDETVLNEHDTEELRRFKVYLRLCCEAINAGCTPQEAANAIYPDVFDEEELLGFDR